MNHYDVVGVDVAKDKWDVCVVSKGKPLDASFMNTTIGFQQFLAYLKKHCDAPWVCMEATGFYSEVLAEKLIQQNIQVSIINPFQIKYFAKAKLARNKNDRVDARIIQTYGSLMKPRVFKPRANEQKALRELVQLLDTLKEQSIQLKHQRRSLQLEASKVMLNEVLDALEKQIKTVAIKIDQVAEKDPHLTESIHLMTSIKGVGKTSAYQLLAQLPPIEFFENAKQLAAYIGVCPRQRESGKYRGKTCLSKYGNLRLRKALYMPALVIKQFNEAFQPFINRLKKNGLGPKAIVCAIMRKLIHILFGILKSKEPFNAQLV